MSEKKAADNKESLGLGDISMIRNILMGQQMSEYESRFSQMEQQLSIASGEQGEKLNDFQKEAKDRFEALESDINERFSYLEKMLKENFEQLKSSSAETRKNDQEALGQMLVEMGQKLIKG